MLRLIALLLACVCLASAGKPKPVGDREKLIAKLEHDLDRAIPRGTPTDKELDILKQARKDLASTDEKVFKSAVDNIDKIAHSNSFRPADASDVRKDIGNIRGHKSFLFLKLP